MPSRRVTWQQLHCTSVLPVLKQLQLARALEGHPAVLSVNYPGLPSHPGHAIAAREMTGGLFGGMLSIRLIGGEKGAVAFTNALHVFTRATSLGGTESLVEHRRSVEGSQPTSPPDLVRVRLCWARL